MQIQISLVNDGDAPLEAVVMHFRKPKEDEPPELVAQYPIGISPELPSGTLLTDLEEGDIFRLV